ncbi:MAG: HEAT repeat domain-containing protein [Elusimicrobia bacterium]|nr:HEAT repeat domain-containing protein [Elusimicrobiota bacterium]
MVRAGRILPFLLPLAAGCAAANLVSIKRAEDSRDSGSFLLTRALKDPSPELRAAAAVAMGRVQSPEYASPLLAALRDSAPTVRSASAFAIGQLRMDETSAAPAGMSAALRSALADTDAGVRASAAEALGKTGGEGVEAELVGLLSDRDPMMRRQAVGGLFRLKLLKRVPEFSTDTVKGLSASLRDPDAEVRWRAAAAFSRAPEPRAAAALIRASLEADDLLRLFAFRSLAKIAKDAPGETVAAWAKAPVADSPLKAAARGAEDPSEQVRVEALGVLAAAKRGDMVPSSAARFPSAHVRAAAAAALAQGNGDAALLSGLLSDASPMVRAQALVGAAEVRGDAAAPEVKRALTDASWWVRSRAMAAAEKLPKEGFALLESGMRDRDLRVRAAALEGLGKRPGELAEAFVVEALLDPSAPLEVVGTAVSAVGERKALSLLKPLESAYRRLKGDEFEEVREEIVGAASALAESFPLDQAVRAFRETLLSDPSPAVRAKAAAALKRPVPDHARIKESPFLEAAPAPVQLILETDKGTLTILLDAAGAPVHAASVAAWARKGKYDGTEWHRVVSDFVIQGGDPRGSGWGGADYSLRDEVNRTPFERGVVGMPKAGKDTGSVQIFIMLSPAPHLDGRYTAFGRVVSGLEVVDRIEPGDKILRATVR